MTLDPISSALATELGKIVLKTVWDGGGKLVSKVGDKANLAKQQFWGASQKYVERYQKRHGTLKVLGMPEPVKLEEVYAAVKFLDQWSLQSYESVEALQDAYRQKGTQRGFRRGDSIKQDGLKVANEKQYLMVLEGAWIGEIDVLTANGTGRPQRETRRL
jgi:hypothetical protein